MPPRVRTPAQRALARAYGLDRWFKQKELRAAYFESTRLFLEALRPLFNAELPPHDAVISALAGAVEHDDSFTAFVLDRPGLTAMTTDDEWARLYTAAGAMIYDSYRKQNA